MTHSKSTTTVPQRLIIGISGASGVIYGVRLLELLKPTDIETHVVISSSAKLTLALETDYTLNDVHELADYVYPGKDIGAAISSGSFKTMGMIVAPCSIRSMSEIASGMTTSLLTRAADVVLKERRRLVLMLRETPLHLGHLKHMTEVTEAGAVIAPPVPAFYARPTSLDDMINHSLGRVLDLFDIEVNAVRRWRDASQQNDRPEE